jgi:hypothetical protein
MTEHQQHQRPVLFLGATGGVTNSALVHTLRASIPCIALARSPQKLQTQLTAQSVTPAQLAHLTIIPGNALNVADLKTALLAQPNPTSASSSSPSLPQTIVTGLGGVPKLKFSLTNPLQITDLDDPHVCENAAKALVSALQELYAEQASLKNQDKPGLAFVSTTGISRGKEDVPFAMRFLYHQMLALPHADKKGMEDVFRGEMEKEYDEGVFRTVSGVRPTLLNGAADVSDGNGWETIRAGTEERPEIGYGVKRADVGEWIF